MKTQTTAPAKVTGFDVMSDDVTVYSVPSRTHAGDVYQVVVAGGRAHCCCKAAQFSRHCCHIAAVDKFRWQEAAPCRHTAPLYRSERAFSIFKAS